MKPSERYKRDAELMQVFRQAYVDLVNHARPHGDGYSLTVLRPNTDNETWQRKRAEVAGAAGMAGVPYARYGGTMTFRNAAYVMHDVNVVANWEFSLRDPEQLSPEVILSSVDAAVARARQVARDATERERGLTGLIAAFLRWPSNLREAVGPDRSAQRTAAGVIGVFGQIVVGIVASLLAAGLLAAGVALWGTLF